MSPGAVERLIGPAREGAPKVIKLSPCVLFTVPLPLALFLGRQLRRVAVAVYRREPVPASYAALMRDLADLADRVADELVADRMATSVIDDLVKLGRATATVEHSDDLSAEVILAQVRSIIADLLAL